MRSGTQVLIQHVHIAATCCGLHLTAHTGVCPKCDIAHLVGDRGEADGLVLDGDSLLSFHSLTKPNTR